VTDWKRLLLRRLVRTRRDDAPPELICREVVEMVTAYLDDALAPGPRAALERHLADCPHCDAYFAQIRLVREAAGRVEPEDVPPQARRELLDLFARWQADGPESGAGAGTSDG
jgi:anti-sigma factor RsiW